MKTQKSIAFGALAALSVGSVIAHSAPGSASIPASNVACQVWLPGPQDHIKISSPAMRFQMKIAASLANGPGSHLATVNVLSAPDKVNALKRFRPTRELHRMSAPFVAMNASVAAPQMIKIDEMDETAPVDFMVEAVKWGGGSAATYRYVIKAETPKGANGLRRKLGEGKITLEGTDGVDGKLEFSFIHPRAHSANPLLVQASCHITSGRMAVARNP